MTVWKSSAHKAEYKVHRQQRSLRKAAIERDIAAVTTAAGRECDDGYRDGVETSGEMKRKVADISPKLSESQRSLQFSLESSAQLQSFSTKPTISLSARKRHAWYKSAPSWAIEYATEAVKADVALAQTPKRAATATIATTSTSVLFLTS